MEISENLKWINKIEEIDVAEGIKNCGMPQHYHKFVRSFYDTIETRIFRILITQTTSRPIHQRFIPLRV